METTVPYTLPAWHLTRLSWTSLLHRSGENTLYWREPLGSAAMRPGWRMRGVPSPASQEMEGAGSPDTGQSSTAPELLEKVKVAGGEVSRAGP